MAGAIAVLSATVLVGSAALLTADNLRARRRAPLDKNRVERLEQLVRQEARHAPVLAAELDRQTAESLRRVARSEQAGRFLIVSAVVFLVSAKRLVRFDTRPVRMPPGRGGRAIGSPPGGEKAGGVPTSSDEGPVPPHSPPDLSRVDQIIAEKGSQPSATVPILQAIQSAYGYVPDDAIRRVCELTEISPARITGVLSFYPQFRRSPMGRHIIKVCHGTACHVAGSVEVAGALRRTLRIAPGTETDRERLFTVQEVACLGCCTLAPVIQIDGVTYGHLTPDKVPDVLRDFLESKRGGEVGPVPARFAEGADWLGEVRIGMGSCCVAGGSGKVRQALERAVGRVGVGVAVRRVGCVGMCHRVPLVEAVLPAGTSTWYSKVTPADAAAIVRRHFPPKNLLRRVWNRASEAIDRIGLDGSGQPIAERVIRAEDESVRAFVDPQVHIATEHSGRIDPTDLDDYLAHDGFKALRRCFRDLSPEEVIEQIRRSGLRGRGGAGYPTGLKWSQVRAAPGEPKYVICNGDEGDPGAFMDRMLMESYPYRLIEGMAIAAYAVGATEAYFYVRAEYPLAVQRIQEALNRCEERGILRDVFGSGPRLRFQIVEGAGAFVCGEETALLASIEGRRGVPRFRPPYPAQSGLWGKPTLVSNVETCAVVPWIIRNGPQAFAGLGAEGSKGTKVFALAGRVVRGGLIEVPMGITLRRIVEEIGGGVRGGRTFKAVQVGGPSGGCIPAERTDVPVDYEALTRLGAIMGSGGLVVLDDSDCMVDTARYFLQFTQNQSCGQCTFCRIGTRRMLEILDRFCTGQARESDLEDLAHLAEMVKKGSLCGLGRTAPNPVLTTLRYFRNEYEAHLKGRCPAGKCKALITYSVTDDCIGCTLCAQYCPSGAIAFMPYEKHHIDPSKCIRCGTCRIKCPVDAVLVE